MKKLILTGIFSILTINSFNTYAEEAPWLTTTCTYYAESNGKKSENTARQFTFYVNDQFQIMKNKNKDDVRASFSAQEVSVQMQDAKHGAIHVVLPRKGYGRFKMYVTSTNQMLAQGSCNVEPRDKCDLFPELCIPSSERGF